MDVHPFVVIYLLILFTVIQLSLTFLVGYLLLLTIASWRNPRPAFVSDASPFLRFLILIPAHNEERLLPDLLESLHRLDYPRHLFDIHVVSDNCTDNTTVVAQQKGVYVHVRQDREHLGKGFALNWLIDRLNPVVDSYDAVVFFDADSIVSTNFLKVISGHLQQGERAIQAYYAVRDPDASWVGSLRNAAFAVLHFLRPMGRMYLGTSAGLKGNGMVFTVKLLSLFSWSSSLTEDIELHAALVLSGERVTFAPDAVVWGEMPNNLSSSVSQHMRWEQGKKRLARQYIPRLLAAALSEFRRGHFRKAFLLFDAVMEFVVPPFSVLVAANLVVLIIHLILLMGLSAAVPVPSSWPIRLAAINISLAVILLIGQGVYLLSGLLLVSASKQVYRNLLYAPCLIVWKTWQMFLALLSKDQNTWIRTKRNRG